MKTPDEIKQGLKHAAIDCRDAHDCDKTCAYYKECTNFDYEITEVPCTMLFDALALIQQLEATVSEKETVIAELSGKIGQLEVDNKLLQDAVDQWELVAASPGAVEDMARENSELVEKVEQLQAERDAAVEAVKRLKCCVDCKHATIVPCMTSIWVDCPKRDGRCSAKSLWEWRGAQKEE